MITLSPEQEYAMRLMNLRRNVFLTGGGGTGKSKVVELFIQQFKDKHPDDWRKYLGITSTTGSSALLIGGTTIHSFSGIGICRGDDDAIIKRTVFRKHLRKRWTELQILIIDEISMLTPRAFRLISRISQIIRKNRSPFGGIQVILSGDFCQLAPILDANERNDTMEYCFETAEWRHSEIETVHFKHIHRQKDVAFIETLQKLRMGISDQDTTFTIMDRYRAELDTQRHGGIRPVMLYATREKANATNADHLRKVLDTHSGGKSYSTTVELTIIPLQVSKKRSDDGSADTFGELTAEKRQEIIQRVKSQLPVDERMELCVGCEVILVINLDIESGLVNGSKGVIEDISVVATSPPPPKYVPLNDSVESNGSSSSTEDYRVRLETFRHVEKPVKKSPKTTDIRAWMAHMSEVAKTKDVVATPAVKQSSLSTLTSDADISAYRISVRFVNGVVHTITAHEWQVEDGAWLVKARGIPLILGYACTIHRSQGMSLDYAVMDIGRNVFKGSAGYGQIYVALSRVRSLEGLSVLDFDPSRIKCHPKVQEFYRQLDSRA